VNELKTRLSSDLVTAMKAKDAGRRDLLRSLLTAIKNEEINQGSELAEKDVVKVLQKQLKQRRESQAAYADRPDLADREEAEAVVIASYLPAELTETELSALVDEAIQITGATQASDLGKVMGAVTPKVAGRAGGAAVAALVKARLA